MAQSSRKKTIAAAQPTGSDRATSKSNLEHLFNAVQGASNGSQRAQTILRILSDQGISPTDSRLAATIGKLKNATKSSRSFDSFVELIKPNIALIDRAIKNELVIPEFAKFRSEVASLFDESRTVRDGQVADYIPQLGRVDPEKFAVAICTVDGQQASFGDDQDRYCLQSSCKPVNYALALEECGEDKVHAHIGREPSGLAFNEITLNSDGLPHNPMINAGAIMSTSLIRQDLMLADRFDYVMSAWSALFGGTEPSYNNAVYLSEKATADRNFAMAYIMRERAAFPERTDLLETLDFYFQCCSIEVDARQMAVAAATFANAGVCPTTNNRVFSNDTVKNCLSLMYSCGMYDFSGEFAFSIGVPAKSGVSGTMMVVIPGVMGIAIWSPRLDRVGNSVRGVDFCRRLIKRYSFHTYDGLSGHTRKIDPTRRGSEGRTDRTYQLIQAASDGDLDEMRRLVALGVSLDTADYDKRTALHLAAAEGQEDAVCFLLRQGVNPAPKDRWGATPLDDANRAKRSAISKLLQQHIAQTAANDLTDTAQALG